jgi:hypothetical protein
LAVLSDQWQLVSGVAQGAQTPREPSTQDSRNLLRGLRPDALVAVIEEAGVVAWH